MKKLAQRFIAALVLFAFVACEDDAVQPMQELEAKVGESFTITGASRLRFTNLEGTTLKMEVGAFTDHIIEGIVSPRTYVAVAVVDSETTSYQIETGYDDAGTCNGEEDRLCNELLFEVDGQALLLKFEEVHWSEPKEDSQGITYIEVDSARLILVRR